MEYLFLFAIVTPLALLVLNLTGFRAGSSPAAVAPELEVPATAVLAAPAIPTVPAFTPAALAEPVEAPSRSVTSTLAGAIGRKRHRRDFFGDYSSAPQTIVAEPVDDGAEIYLMPRRDVAPAMAPSGPPAAHARPGGSIVSFPRHTPLVTSGNVAQR